VDGLPGAGPGVRDLPQRQVGVLNLFKAQVVGLGRWGSNRRWRV
jgi:hypothetical protein